MHTCTHIHTERCSSAHMHACSCYAGKPPSPAELVAETHAAIAATDGPTLLVCDSDGDVLELAWVQYELWATAAIKGANGWNMFKRIPELGS